MNNVEFRTMLDTLRSKRRMLAAACLRYWSDDYQDRIRDTERTIKVLSEQGKGWARGYKGTNVGKTVL